MDLGLLQREVAARIGVDGGSVWNWENGRAEPELRFLPAILAFLGYDPRKRAETLAEQLVTFRKTKGWSQSRFARELKVNPSTLARWERDERQPSGRYAEGISMTLMEASPMFPKVNSPGYRSN